MASSPPPLPLHSFLAAIVEPLPPTRWCQDPDHVGWKSLVIITWFHNLPQQRLASISFSMGGHYKGSASNCTFHQWITTMYWKWALTKNKKDIASTTSITSPIDMWLASLFYRHESIEPTLQHQQAKLNKTRTLMDMALFLEMKLFGVGLNWLGHNGVLIEIGNFKIRVFKIWR